MNHTWWMHLLWILIAAGAGLAVTAIFAGRLHLRRSLFLIPYVLLVGVLLGVYFRWSGVNVAEQVSQHWPWGIVGAVLAGAFLIKNVVSQPQSERAQGSQLVVEILWHGVVYGTWDALLLSVMPVFAVWQMASVLGWSASVPGKIAAGIVALAASALVTVAYHAGYPEFQGRQMVKPVIGNSVCTLAYVLTANPIAAIASHVAMHVAAVLRGPERAAQLPPHYAAAQ